MATLTILAGAMILLSVAGVIAVDKPCLLARLTRNRVRQENACLAVVIASTLTYAGLLAMLIGLAH